MDGEEPVDLVHIERLPERAIGAGDDLRDAGCRQGEADDERAARLEKFAPRNRRAYMNPTLAAFAAALPRSSLQCALLGRPCGAHALVSLPFAFARITARRMR